MKRTAIVLAFVAVNARADTIIVKLGSPNGLSGWTRTGAEPEVDHGELRSASLTTWSRAVPFDATRGWVIEARFSAELDAPSGGTAVIGSDGRQSASFTRQIGNTVTLDGDSTTIVDDDRPHTYRLEVLGGHHRLLIDGKLVLENDREISSLESDPDLPHVSFGAEDGAPGTPTTHWLALKLDTAPRGLAKSAFPVRPLARFTGPFAAWLTQLAFDVPELALELSRVKLSEDARACVAFAIVRAGGASLPDRFRRDDFVSTPPPAPSNQSRHPICDPAGPCDCGRCPKPKSDAEHAKASLLAALDATSAENMRLALDDAVNWMLPKSVAAATAPMTPDERKLQPAPASFSAYTVKPLLAEFRRLATRPRACR
jgi:hypothetical protein